MSDSTKPYILTDRIENIASEPHEPLVAKRFCLQHQPNWSALTAGGTNDQDITHCHP